MGFKKIISWSIAGLGLFIIIYFFFRLEAAYSDIKTPEYIYQAIKNFQISIWCGWVLITLAAILIHWRDKGYTFFIFDYLVVITAFILLGLYMNQGASADLWTIGSANTQDVSVMIIMNILLICGMTAFIQGAIWWFSKKWHRR